MLGPPSTIHSSGLDPVLESDSESLSSLTTRRGLPLPVLSKGLKQRLGVPQGWEGSYSLPGQKPPRLYWEMVIQLRLDASRSRELTTSPGSLGPGYSECGPLTKKLSSIKMQSPPRPHLPGLTPE